MNIFSSHSRTGEIPHSSPRVFHQVGGSEVGSNDLGRESETILLEKNNMPLRTPSPKQRRDQGQPRFALGRKGDRSCKGGCSQGKGGTMIQSKGLSQKAQKEDLVLRRVLRNNTSNKLTPNWEGPYRIVEEVGKGAFRLEHLDGKRVPRT
ncbi:hypothetical protein CR513_27454, partial [Mucuna pruriens]